MVFKEFLFKLESCKKNPWKDEAFDINFGEAYAVGLSYDVLNVSIIFNKSSCFVQFFDEDCVIASAIVSLIVSCPYDFDEDIEVFVNKKQILMPTSKQDRLDPIKVFKSIFKVSEELSNFVEYEIIFSKKQSFTFQTKGIYFIVDKDHHDLFYFEKELRRR